MKIKWAGLLAVTLVPIMAVADQTYDVLSQSMRAKNSVSMDRLTQDSLQAYCSKPRDEANYSTAAAIRESRLAAIAMPADGVFVGDWRQGHDVANNGRGLQYSDDPSQPNGGNCYACHQLDPREVAYGTIGPSLTNYGARGQSDVMLRYTWTKIWDTHAYNVCSHMPRFGAQGILTEQQIKDVMAYLMDPDSPVNRPVEE
ncbi:conserved hypothetical protein [Luminiphilus syltensis NOR5-1B]|uniref:Cytochrome c domain-containing protein n=1 Tax=Luminiphilus syltensis NOR5-1B TaxID=565045 RepID=B8KX48_9GAMM|nr:sulfur oxidation c-type cytochrome SoxX [Luminiphilus syltensis]EED34587.1 conserved hypothetical protein [Luminiphilus syltensis NOR5-1B]